MILRNGSPNFGGLFDVDSKRELIQEIESQIAAPGFWDAAEKSQAILKQRTALEKTVQMWDDLTRQLEDVRVMIELGTEAQDEETLKETALMNDRLQAGVDAAEFQRMLSGEHDRNNCFISINPGAGGTESQEIGRAHV